jgi:hypothetical protein
MADNINIKKDFLYLLRDELNDGILHATDSYDAATAMSLFSPRITLTPIETHTPWLKENLKTPDYKNKDAFLKWEPKNALRFVVPLEKEEITPKYISYKNEIIARTRYQELLITHCDMLLVTNGIETPMLERYAATIVSELSKCSVEENTFSPAIVNYAIISEIDTVTAFNELKLHIDNMAQTRLRNLAVYIKFRNILNRSPLADQGKIFESAISAIYRASQG